MVPASIVINIAIFGITAYLVIGCFRKDGAWSPEKGKVAFRYFTVQSNVFCALASLLTAVCLLAGNLPEWAVVLKYMGTAAVTLTMLTVLLFLGQVYAYKPLLSGSDFFMHLLNPLLALVSFCVFEKQPMTFGTALFGMVPILLYGPLYLYKTIFAPEQKRWDDFYAFNRQGKWPVALVAMFAAHFLICMGIMALRNL